jgi:hypothetical protein
MRSFGLRVAAAVCGAHVAHTQRTPHCRHPNGCAARVCRVCWHDTPRQMVQIRVSRTMPYLRNRLNLCLFLSLMAACAQGFSASPNGPLYSSNPDAGSSGASGAGQASAGESGSMATAGVPASGSGGAGAPAFAGFGASAGAAAGRGGSAGSHGGQGGFAGAAGRAGTGGSGGSGGTGASAGRGGAGSGGACSTCSGCLPPLSSPCCKTNGTCGCSTLVGACN